MNEAEINNVDETTAQESPTVEENEIDSETGENLEETPEVADDPQERNWRALREENERLKKQIKESLPMEEVEPFKTPAREELGLFLTPDEKSEIRLHEIRAEQDFPEIETDPMFKRAVEGAYISALAEYNNAMLANRKAPIPNAYKIAKSIKKEFDDRFGQVSKQAEVEGAKKAQAAKESKLSTKEAEGRSDRGKVLASQEDLNNLREKSRQGGTSGIDAITQRLEQSKL